MAGKIDLSKFRGPIMIPIKTLGGSLELPIYGFIDFLDRCLWCRAMWENLGLLWYPLSSLEYQFTRIKPELEFLKNDPGYWCLVARKFRNNNWPGREIGEFGLCSVPTSWNLD